MIQDNQCDRVFFSALLRKRCPIAFRGLTEVLDKYDVPWSLQSTQAQLGLILPKFGIDEDEQAFEQNSSLMPEYAGRIEMVVFR